MSILNRSYLLIFLFIFITPFQSYSNEQSLIADVAAETEPEFLPESELGFSPMASALQMLLALGCVVGLAYLVLHRGLGSILGRQRQGGTIKVKERIPLDGKHSLFLVEVNKHLLVLSTSERGVKVIMPALPSQAPETPARSFSVVQKNVAAGV